MEISPVTRKEHFLARAAGDEDALELQPVTREEHFLQNIIDAIEEGGGGGGSVTAAAVASAIGDMSSAQASQALSDLGGEPEKFVVTVTYDDQTDSYSADKTFAEIETAYNAKKTVIVLLPEVNNTELQLSLLYPFDGGYGTADFYGIMPPAGVYRTTIIGVSVESDGQSDTWNYTEFIPQEVRQWPIFGTTPTITPEANTIYNGGTLTSLTISNPPATGEYEIDFISGATPTVCAFDDIRWPDNTAPTIAANTEYEISVKNNKGLCVGWPVQSGGDT